MTQRFVHEIPIIIACFGLKEGQHISVDKHGNQFLTQVLAHSLGEFLARGVTQASDLREEFVGFMDSGLLRIVVRANCHNHPNLYTFRLFF